MFNWQRDLPAKPNPPACQSPRRHQRHLPVRAAPDLSLLLLGTSCSCSRSFSIYNFTVYAIITLFQVDRILREERILALPQEYRDYLERIRYRFCPGVF